MGFVRKCFVLEAVYLQYGWSLGKNLPSAINIYVFFLDYITVIEEVIFHVNRVFLPELQRGEVLEEINEEHQVKLKCICLAAGVVWRPAMTKGNKSG